MKFELTSMIAGRLEYLVHYCSFLVYSGVNKQRDDRCLIIKGPNEKFEILIFKIKISTFKLNHKSYPTVLQAVV